MDVELKKIQYFKVTDLWKRFCEEHTTLLDLTFAEYSCLLSSEIDDLEEILEKKNVIITKIRSLEKLRQNIIDEINQTNDQKVQDVSGLLVYMSDFEQEKEQQHLKKFNLLLIDLIEKLKAQNKKNQLFLNKAISSLKNIKEQALGKKSYSTYGQNGNEKSNVIP